MLPHITQQWAGPCPTPSPHAREAGQKAQRCLCFLCHAVVPAAKDTSRELPLPQRTYPWVRHPRPLAAEVWCWVWLWRGRERVMPVLRCRRGCGQSLHPPEPAGLFSFSAGSSPRPGKARVTPAPKHLPRWHELHLLLCVGRVCWRAAPPVPSTPRKSWQKGRKTATGARYPDARSHPGSLY